jgi:hypothetical protein
MTRRPRAIARSGPIPAVRRWVTLLALLGFFLQGLAVQTHVHPLDATPAAKLVASHAAPVTPSKSQEPIDQCRLCQELVHAGSFITPSAALLASPLAQVQAIPLVLLPPRAQSAPAFAWQSRAPPHR